MKLADVIPAALAYLSTEVPVPSFTSHHGQFCAVETCVGSARFGVSATHFYEGGGKGGLFTLDTRDRRALEVAEVDELVEALGALGVGIGVTWNGPPADTVSILTDAPVAHSLALAEREHDSSRPRVAPPNWPEVDA